MKAAPPAEGALAWWRRVVRYALRGGHPDGPEEVPAWALCVPWRIWRLPNRIGEVPADAGKVAALRARLDRIAAGEERKASPTLQPGSRLLREWNGTTHVVDITDAGYVWNGKSHRSLSAIAREITGARWSGPRFFGIQ